MANKRETKTKYELRTGIKSDGLILSGMLIKEVYEVPEGMSNTPVLVSTGSKELFQYILHSTTVDEIEQWRKDPGVIGLIYKEDGQIYSAEISEDEIKQLDSYAQSYTHLCGMNCKAFCPSDKVTPPCAKVLNVKCNHIEKYEFITDGYEVFAPHMQSILYVSKCTDYFK